MLDMTDAAKLTHLQRVLDDIEGDRLAAVGYVRQLRGIGRRVVLDVRG